MTTLLPTLASPYQTATLALSLIQIAFGINGLFRPLSHLKALNLPIPASLSHPSPSPPSSSSPPSNSPADSPHPDPATVFPLALMRIWGIRNLTLGSILLLIVRSGDTQLLGNAVAVVVSVPLVDGFVARSVVGAGERSKGVLEVESMHWVVVPMLVGCAGGLWSWW